MIRDYEMTPQPRALFFGIQIEILDMFGDRSGRTGFVTGLQKKSGHYWVQLNDEYSARGHNMLVRSSDIELPELSEFSELLELERKFKIKATVLTDEQLQNLRAKKDEVTKQLAKDGIHGEVYVGIPELFSAHNGGYQDLMVSQAPHLEGVFKFKAWHPNNELTEAYQKRIDKCQTQWRAIVFLVMLERYAKQTLVGDARTQHEQLQQTVQQDVDRYVQHLLQLAPTKEDEWFEAMRATANLCRRWVQHLRGRNMLMQYATLIVLEREYEIGLECANGGSKLLPFKAVAGSLLWHDDIPVIGNGLEKPDCAPTDHTKQMVEVAVMPMQFTNTELPAQVQCLKRRWDSIDD